MKRSRTIVSVIVIALSLLGIYSLISWDRSNGSFPPEVQQLVAGTTADVYVDFANFPMGDVDPENKGWFADHQFTLVMGPRALLDKAKKLLTKERGWNFVIPNPKVEPYCFHAEKRDSNGKLVTAVDFSGEADDLQCYFHATDQRHPYPWYRAWWAQKRRENNSK